MTEKNSSAKRPKAKVLDEMIKRATTGARNEWDDRHGFLNMMEDHLAMPFYTHVLGVPVFVERVDMTDDSQIVAVCRRAEWRQMIPILHLPLPEPRPAGWEWVDAFRRWATSR